MIVTCQTCNRRYLIDRRSVPSEGRTVRCAACNHMWLQLPLKEENSEMKRLELDSLGATAQSALLQLENTKNARWLSIGWLIYGFMILFIIGGGILAREPLAFTFPRLQKLYKAVGLPVAPPGEGLRIQSIRAIHTVANGREGMILRGEIQNTSDQVKPLPPVHITYRATKACQQSSKLLNKLSFKDPSIPPCQPIRWSFSLSQDRLLAGEKIFFETPMQEIPGKDTQGHIYF